MKFFYLSSFLLSYAIVSYAQVELLTELNPGTGYTSVRYLTKFQGQVFFFTTNSSSSTAVWRLYKTDGTAAGTEVVYESDSINPKLDVRSVAVAGNKMYFLTKKDWVWETDGTNGGTKPVTAFYRNDTLQYLNDLVVPGNGYAYVSVANKGLGRIDTATLTVDTFYNKLAGVEIIFEENGTAFTNTDPYNNTAETGIYDLNQSKFLLRKSVDSFSIKQYPLSTPDMCIQFLNSHEFIAVSQGFSDAPELPIRVFKYNMLNDTKVLLREYPEFTYGSAGARATLNGKVLWVMRTPGAGNSQAYVLVTDGTVAGTYTFDPPGRYSYTRPIGMTTYAGKVLFVIESNESQSHKTELWTTDGTLAGCIKITQSTDSLAGISYGDTLGGYLYFEHHSDHLWRTDGTSQGTTEVCNDTKISRFDGMLNLNGTLVFSAHNFPCVGTEVWATELNNACNIAVTCPAGINDVLVGKLSVYPNPAGNELNVMIPVQEEVLSLQLLSPEGKLLKEEKNLTKDIYSLSLQDIAEGFYLVKLHSVTGYYTAKVVVQR